MNNNISPYRVTADDLTGDKQTIATMQPVLDALNDSLSSVINVTNAQLMPDLRNVQLVTGAVVADSFPYKFATQISKVSWAQMTNCTPKDPAHSLVTPFVMQAWLAGPGLIQVGFITGLLPNQQYSLQFVVF